MSIFSTVPPGEYMGSIVAARHGNGMNLLASLSVEIDGWNKVLVRDYTKKMGESRLINDLAKICSAYGVEFETIEEAIDWLIEVKPKVCVSLDKPNMINVFVPLPREEHETSEVVEPAEATMIEAPETQEQADIEEYGGQILKYDDHYFKRIIGRNVRCRECREQGELLPTFCLMPSSGYGHRWGLTFEQVQNKLQARKQGKPISEC